MAQSEVCARSLGANEHVAHARPPMVPPLELSSSVTSETVPVTMRGTGPTSEGHVAAREPCSPTPSAAKSERDSTSRSRARPRRRSWGNAGEAGWQTVRSRSKSRVPAGAGGPKTPPRPHAAVPDTTTTSNNGRPPRTESPRGSPKAAAAGTLETPPRSLRGNSYSTPSPMSRTCPHTVSHFGPVSTTPPLEGDSGECRPRSAGGYDSSTKSLPGSASRRPPMVPTAQNTLQRQGSLGRSGPRWGLPPQSPRVAGQSEGKEAGRLTRVKPPPLTRRCVFHVALH